MQIPDDYQGLLAFSETQIQALCEDLLNQTLTPENLDTWLRDSSQLGALFQECMARFDISTSVNTADQDAREKLSRFRENIWPIARKFWQGVDQRLGENIDRLPEALREVRKRRQPAQALNQSPDTWDLLNREAELIGEYEQIVGAQTVHWQGKTVPLRQLRALLGEPNREQRELAWKTLATRRMQDRDAIADVWTRLLDTRQLLAQANGFDDYLTYRWTELEYWDYSPQENQSMHESLRRHWVPLYAGMNESLRQGLELETLRPWDVLAPLPQQPPLQPFAGPEELLQKIQSLFRRMDPEFGDYIDKLRSLGFIDLAERSDTSAMTGFSRAIGRHGNFILLNIQKTQEDVVNLVHEIGHALALYASCKLPYQQFWGFPATFSETPSSAMEMLSQPYWDEFYAPAELQIARQLYFRDLVRSSINDCMQDALQHWIYRNPQDARSMTACDEHWQLMTSQYLPGTDWTGLDAVETLPWQGNAIYLPLLSMGYIFGRLAGLKLLELPAESALRRYKSAIALGSSSSARNLFASLDLPFPVSEADFQSAAHLLATRI